MINIVLCLAVLVSAPMTLERVIAVVGAEPVLHSDVVSLMIESGIDQEDAFNSDPSSSSYHLAMTQVIEEKLLVESARRKGMYPDTREIDAAVEDAMARVRNSFHSQQEFIDYLASTGMTVEALRNSYTAAMGDKIASENYVRDRAGVAMKTMPSDPVTFFLENEEIVHEVLAPKNLSWIYLPILPGDTQAAEILLSEVRAEIEAGETTFSAAAAAYSQDGSASSGGDLGWFVRGDMTATFEGVVYSLEPGEIAGPFLTPFGVHLVKLTDLDEERVRASHIIIVVERSAVDLERTQLQAEELVAGFDAGMDFTEAVRNFSLDPDPGNVDGYLGTVNVGAWEGEMRAGAIDLNPGEVSRPVIVEQNMAIAVFKASEDQMINWEEFSSDELASMLQSVYWQTYYLDMVESLRSDISVVMNIQ